MSAPADSSPRVCVGAIAGAHGVKGEARIRAFTDDPFDVAAYGEVETEDGSLRFGLTILREAKPGVLIVALEGVELSREEVQALGGTQLFIPRSALPEPEDEDEFYYSDLIGLSATYPDGSPCGTILAVADYGAGDMLDIKLATSSKTVVIPFTKQAVPTVDIKAGRVVVDPPAGLIDDAEKGDDDARQ